MIPIDNYVKTSNEGSKETRTIQDTRRLLFRPVPGHLASSRRY